jgi:DNA-binding CsgD family transcriptional regulator/predicted negative regulator of RcsB-dependent stress response
VSALPAGTTSIMEVVLRRVSSPTFVGRGDELALLESALARSSEGIPSFMFVAGESGVGKSRIVGELEARAPDAGMRVVVGHCMELGGTVFPYGPVVGALRAAGEPFPEASSQAEVFEALLELLGRLGPIALVIEDLHWADPSTRDFLVFLVRSARVEPLCLVVTYRSDELHRRHPLRPVLAELERVPGVQRLELARFNRDEVAEQLTGILDGAPDVELADRLYARAQGNAFYTEELLAASADGAGELPGTLRDALLARFERLPAAAQNVLRVAAVAERPVGHALLAAACPLAEAELLAGAREAVAHQLLVTGPDGTYAFRHALVGEAIYDDLLPGERTALHAALAEAIERDPALLGDVPAGALSAELACHWHGAHDLPRALGASVAAGVEARRVYAQGEALRHFENALALWERVPDAAERAAMPRSDVLRQAAAAAHEGFESARSVALQREALAAADAGPIELARLHAELAHYLRHANDHDAGDAELRLALELLPPDAELERARLRDQSSKSLMLRGQFREAAAEAAMTAADARRLGALDLEAGANNTEGISRGALGEVDEGARLLRRARDIAVEIGSPPEHVRAVSNLAELLDLSGRTEEALAEVLAALPVVRGHPERSIYDAFLELQGASELLRLGRTAEAAATLPDRIPSDSISSTATFHAALLAMVALQRGHYDAARAALDETRRQLARNRHPQWVEVLETMTAQLAVHEGRLDDARAAADRGIPLVERTEEGGRLVKLVWAALMVEAEAAELADALGQPFDDGPAAALRARLEAARERPGQWAEGPCYALLAEAEYARVEHALGRADPDPAAWLKAAAAFEALALPWPVAYARLHAAEALVAAGDRTAAADPLAAAHAAAEAIEAAPLATAAQALARRARIRLDTPAAKAPEPAPLGLTPREHEVLLLVAEGHTNREIGARLYMSEKTASVHVSRILAKLDVSGRVEAAAVAHRLGLTRTLE